VNISLAINDYSTEIGHLVINSSFSIHDNEKLFLRHLHAPALFVSDHYSKFSRRVHRKYYHGKDLTGRLSGLGRADSGRKRPDCAIIT
jgi:hypothetical protein